MSRKLILVVLVGLLAVPAVWRFVLYFLASGKMTTPPEEKVRPAEPDSRLVVCSGYADLEGGITALYPSQAGRVAEVLVKENDPVPANAVLLRLDDRTARCRVAEARALLDKARAELAKAEKAPEHHQAQLDQQK